VALAGLGGVIILTAIIAAWLIEEPMVSVVLYTPVPTATPSATVTPQPTFTATSTPPAPSAMPPPTPTGTRVVPEQVYSRKPVKNQGPIHIPPQLSAQPQRPILKPVTAGQSARPAINFGRNSRLVLAHYFAWYSGSGWNDCNISAGDKPLQPYDSSDPAAIARHVGMAQEIGLNGFTLHWFAPGDPTDRNFGNLLAQAEGTDFAATVVFSHHIWHGRPRNIPDALSYIINQYSRHPNFLRRAGKPVIFFTDMYRTPAPTPQQYWATLRNQLDPQRQTIWIAEGLDPSYLDTFDGLYVFKVSHAAYPHDYQKSSRWAERVRRQGDNTNQSNLWIATISPGWDDLRSGCKPDVRVDNQPHRLDRAGGATYQAIFEAATQSNPDWLMVGSFNEWVEGTYIEPSQQYGDKYLHMTAEFIEQFKGQ